MTNDPNTSKRVPAAPAVSSADGEGVELFEYVLMKLALSERRVVPISRNDFKKIANARDCLLQLAIIEEKFDVVVENLAALEKSVRDAADLCKIAPVSTIQFQIAKSDINRNVANLVALGRVFIEQSLVHAANLRTLAGVELFDLAAARTRQYDARIGYRLFEELRNYMLHRGSAVHFVEFQTRKEYDATGAISLRHEVIAYASASQLAEDKKFKRRVSSELSAMADRQNLVAMARDYVAGLWDSQIEFRSALEVFVSDNEAAYTGGAFLYANAPRQDGPPLVVGLVAACRDARGMIKEQTPIVLDLMDLRRHYEEKNDHTARCRLEPGSPARI